MGNIVNKCLNFDYMTNITLVTKSVFHDQFLTQFTFDVYCLCIDTCI